jgi:hypothetical protein
VRGGTHALGSRERVRDGTAVGVFRPHARSAATAALSFKVQPPPHSPSKSSRRRRRYVKPADA